MKSFEPLAYALLRIVSGSLLVFHGTSQLFDWPTIGHDYGLPKLFFAFGLLEFGGGLLITIGWFTRPAAIALCAIMAVFYWTRYADSHKLLPIQNKGEWAVLFCFVFLLIWARGSGKLSVDRWRENAKKN